MTVSSRTPEGFPSQCPLCGASTNIEFSDPAGDAPCPNCGCLLWTSAQFVETATKWHWEVHGTAPAELTADTRFTEWDLDSLDLVELVLEETFDIEIPDGAYDQIQTIGDVMRYIKIKRRDTDESE
jgi:acyl carrier protein